jgi:plasmid stabilization system protein ParE
MRIPNTELSRRVNLEFQLARLYEFVAPLNAEAAAGIVRSLARASTTLLANPRIGEQLFEFEPSEVRRIILGRYEIRYEIQDATIYVLRLWHTKEER